MTQARGVIPPVPTFFDAAGELDLATLRRHIGWLAEYPLGGILALGSNGEAMHLDDQERVAVIRAVREALDAAGGALPLLAGTADQSTRGTIARCRAAAAAGAELAVVLPPYAFPSQMSPAAIRAHFTAVADASPIPILIYNMPANTANLDLSADLIIALADHPNIVGVKDSGGQVAKLAQIVAAVPPEFTVLAGSGSFLLPTLAVGGHGAIAAVANVIPGATAALAQEWNAMLAEPSVATERLRQLQTQQGALIPLNQLVTATFGVAGLKAALEVARGYGGAPRPPLLALDDTQRALIQRRYTEFYTC